MGEELKIAFNYLDKIAQKLGLVACELFPYFVKQQYIESAKGFIFTVISLAVIFFILKVFIKKISDSYDDSEKFAICVVSMILLFFPVTTALDSFDNCFRFLNPEYYALKDIMKFIK